MNPTASKTGGRTSRVPLLMVAGVGACVFGAALVFAGLARMGERPARLTWREPEIRSALMTFAYKVYGNPKVDFGRHYLSKLVFKNEGEHPVTDFEISYKIEGYIPWTEPEVVHAIPPGFTLVRLYYPKLPATVTKIRNATNTTLQVRFRWKEEGRQREESFSRDIVLRGVNELAYCDLPQNEVQSWFDAGNAFSFTAAMVTPNDPVVDLYTSQITKLSGGTTAGFAGGGREVVRLCRAVYDYMLRTGLRYTSDSGVPANYDNISTLVQTVRLPRDVIINNQGLCIELSILWSSILEHLGVDSVMVSIPGHTFVIAYSSRQGMPLQQGLPIECTAITPRAVHRQETVSFDEAVQLAAKELQAAEQDGRIILVPVKELQAMGFTPPELPEIDVTKVAEMLEKRLHHDVPDVNPMPPIPGPAPVPAPAPAGVTTWRHPQGYVTVSFPADFVSLLPPGNNLGFMLLSMGNPATTVACDVMQVSGTQDPVQALNYISSVFAPMGARLEVTGTASRPDGTVMFSGMTISATTMTRWTCVARAVPGAVVLVSAGTNPNVWETQSATVQAILSSVHFL